MDKWTETSVPKIGLSPKTWNECDMATICSSKVGDHNIKQKISYKDFFSNELI